MSGFVVKYKLDPEYDGDGDGSERVTEVYPDRNTARMHADDIRGYAGVQYAVVEPASSEPPARSAMERIRDE